MPELKRTFLVDSDGVFASVPASEVDTYIPLGWKATTTEPADGDLVWLEHETTGGKAKFAQAVVPQWQGLGWQPTAAPKPADTLHDPQLVDVALEPTEPAEAKSPKAAGGAKKEQ